MNLNIDKLRDKIYACWLGKNIGGTIGGPYEGSRELLNSSGFTTPPNQALPNDDLDLQLLWLKAVEDYGIGQLDERLLGEYWVSFITGQWNEYGIAKLNLADGLISPLSGNYRNDWKNSNGAWIRTEIWACMMPACPNCASRYAKMDAMVDHGAGEGTYAAIFVAAMQSAAFAENNIRTLIEIGLTKIPENCRTARAIKLAVKCYDGGETWQSARNAILNEVKDIGDGWFEAPGNVAYVIIGLLYGNGDFKNSVLTALNCGDDTDCTAATVGATLGILGGTAALPQDWVKHIGDGIITCALNCGLDYRFPSSCTELTERVINQIPDAMLENKTPIVISHDTDCITEDYIRSFKEYDNSLEILHNGNYFSLDFTFCRVFVCFNDDPHVKPNGSVRLKFQIKGNDRFGNSPYNFSLRWLLPDGWSVAAPARHYHNARTWRYEDISEFEATVYAGDTVEPLNRIILEMTVPQRPTVCLIPIGIIGE